MPYCSRCGVEVDDDVKKCPLCSAEIQIFDNDPPRKGRYPEKPAPHASAPRRNRKERRKMAAMIVTFGLLIPACIAITADFVLNGQITWGTYTISSLIYIWVIVLLPLLYYKTPVLTLMAYYLSTLLYLYSIETFTGGGSWFRGLALPIITVTTVLIAANFYAAGRSRIRGINIFSYAVLSVGLECMGIEMIISRHLTGNLKIGWSVIVLSAAVPASILLWYIHHKVKRPLKADKFFHI